MAASEHNESYHPDMWVFPEVGGMTRNMADKTSAMPRKFALALTAAGALFVLGIIGFAFRAIGDGFDNHEPWGYYAAIFSFIFMVTGAAPLAAVAFRFTKSHWRRPLSRISEMFAFIGLLSTLMLIPLLLVLPSINNPTYSGIPGEELEIRRTIWFEGPIGAPIWWDLFGVIFLALASLTILWLSALPDLAESRLTATGWRRKLYSLL